MEVSALDNPANGLIRFIPLGGVGEIGKNLALLWVGDDIVVIDSGVAFPEEDMPGIDLVLPDISFVLEHRERVRGIFLTHGHEDHVGALPYVLRDLPVPVYGSRLTMGIVDLKLEEHHMQLPPGSRVVQPGERVTAGRMRVEFFRVNHSIPDAMGLIVRTPAGTVVHTGDFKFDQTPVDGQVAHYERLADLGRRGVKLLLSDSTNAERAGYTPSERTVGQTLERIIAHAPGRVLVASFASHVHRVAQTVEIAIRHGRRVAVVGRSMENVVRKAQELGHLPFPPGTWLDVDEIGRQPAHKVVILTTGSQGEPMSALSRMASADHKQVEIQPGDTVVIAASPIPGNEKLVARTVDNLFRRGATVIYGIPMGVHVSGHASQEELKLMLNLTRPQFFVPVHGEYRHLVHHAQLAREVGIPSDHIFIGENGTVFEFGPEAGRIAGQVPWGKVLVDGVGVGDVGHIVLRDRRQLSQDGVMIVVLGIDSQTGELVSGPDVVSRGFVYVRESESLMEEARQRVREAVRNLGEESTEWTAIKAAVRETLGKLLFERTRRRPMILPIVMEV
jgi:ribonuclease J